MRLIEKIWFKNHPAFYLLMPLLFIFSSLFFLLSLIRRWLFSLNVFSKVKLSVPVIVVGNIGVGGNGKTPMVIYLVQQCLSLGLKPGVLSRGYGSKAPHYPYLVIDESSAIEAGDEPLLIYQRCKVPVVIGSDRIADGKLLEQQGCNIIISDDGLQHYRLDRDLEIIVVDGKRLFGNGWLLPAGPLREGLWRLENAERIIINGILSYQHRCLENALSMELTAQYVCNLATNEKVPLAQFETQHKQINALAGIGDPDRFFSTLNKHGFKIECAKGFVDHHKYVQTDLDSFDDNMPLLMTEKDAVKCQHFAKSHYWYLPVSATFSDETDEILRQDIYQLISEIAPNIQ